MELLVHLYKFNAKSGNEQQFTAEVVNLLKERGATVTQDEYGNVYAVKGESDTYPCVVAHLDEVHQPRSNKFQVVVTSGGIIKGYDSVKKGWRHGIAADDRNGIWVALKALETFDAIKVAFFPGEEVGCKGSSQANMQFFKDCRFVLECDRRNSSDLITNISGTELCSKEFLEAINHEDWGYQTCDGLSTDVCALKERELEVSCCNMSCGYYNPHTPSEYTVFSELEKCLAFVNHIIKDCTAVYTHHYKPSRYYYGGWGSEYYGGGYRTSHYGRGGYLDDSDWYDNSKDSKDTKKKSKELKLSAYLSQNEKRCYDYIIELFKSGVYAKNEVRNEVFDKEVFTYYEFENAFSAAEEDYYQDDEKETSSTDWLDDETRSEILDEIYTMLENGCSECEIFDEIRDVWGLCSDVTSDLYEEALMAFEADKEEEEEKKEEKNDASPVGTKTEITFIASLIIKFVRQGYLNPTSLCNYFTQNYHISNEKFVRAFYDAQEDFSSRGFKIPTTEEYVNELIHRLAHSLKMDKEEVRAELNKKYDLEIEPKKFEEYLGLAFANIHKAFAS